MGGLFSSNEDLCRERVAEIKGHIKYRTRKLRQTEAELEVLMEDYRLAKTDVSRKHIAHRMKQKEVFGENLHKSILRLEEAMNTFELLSYNAADIEQIDAETTLLNSILCDFKDAERNQSMNEINMDILKDPVRPLTDSPTQMDQVTRRLDSLQVPTDLPSSEEKMVYMSM